MTQLNDILKQYNTQSHEVTAVAGTSCSQRDGLLASQHPASSINDEVHMDADYVFDVSMDDSIDTDTQLLCKALVREYPQSEMFIFLP